MSKATLLIGEICAYKQENPAPRGSWGQKAIRLSGMMHTV
jgi:hypothetical protein